MPSISTVLLMIASPMLNRQHSHIYCNRFKYVRFMCTTIAGMDTGIISSGTTFYCSGSFDKVTPSPKCWRLSGHGGEVAATAIRDSCNVFFYNVGYNLACSKNGNYNSTLRNNYYRNTQTFWVYRLKQVLKLRREFQWPF